MKTTKRILILLLTLALGLALFAPMAAAKEQRAILFTKRMFASSMTSNGKAFTLAPKAKLPAGVNAQLKYQWYTKDWNDGGGAWYPVAGATGPTLTLSFTVGLSDSGFPYCYKPYYLRASYKTGDTVVYDNCYTTVGYYMDLPDCYKALNMAAEQSSLPQAIAKPMIFPMILPTYVLLGNAVWPTTLVSTAVNAIGG
ncbi:MAG: hypothetical protein FWF60_00305 [Oscillospiraceae bacterium]|nr:hypothetical protein [Oscillospiraceae bacterium]